MHKGSSLLRRHSQHPWVMLEWPPLLPLPAWPGGHQAPQPFSLPSSLGMGTAGRTAGTRQRCQSSGDARTSIPQAWLDWVQLGAAALSWGEQKGERAGRAKQQHLGRGEAPTEPRGSASWGKRRGEWGAKGSVGEERREVGGGERAEWTLLRGELGGESGK